MLEDFDHHFESDPEVAFLETAVRYLDNQLSNQEAGNFLNDLGVTPQRRALFVTLCIQSQVLVEKLAAKSASDALLGLDPNAALRGVAVPIELTGPRRASAVVINPIDLPT